MDFQIAISESGNLGGDDEAEEHGALDMVECEIGGVCACEFEGFGDERCVGDGDTGENAGWEGGHGGVYLKRGIVCDWFK